jgi:GH24 family phage-related lysozyme (muramidase)
MAGLLASDARIAPIPKMHPRRGLLDTSPDQSTEAALVDDTGNIDWDFIGVLEGSRINGYIPKDKKGKILGKSGVTIGTGVDLGSKNAAYFSELDKSIRDKLSPYFGLKGTAAANKLKADPLGLTKEEVIKINKITKKSEIANVKERWKSAEKAENLPENFDDLPKWMATPVVSALFQYGANSSPSLWRAVTSGDVPAIEKELRSFTNTGDYQTRRDAEADYLTGTLKKTPRSRGDLRRIIQKNTIDPMLDKQGMDAF